MRRIPKILILLFLTFSLIGQVVTTEPAFPTQLDDVTIYFDAKQGNGGLAGFTGDVYAHTGVITSESNSPNDWRHVQGEWGVAFPKTLMTRVGEDLYTISFNIADFYGVGTDETVESLAFVFRSTDGSVTGRADDGSDIFTPIYLPDDALLLSVYAPGENGEIIFEDDSLQVDLATNVKSLVLIRDNDVEIFKDSVQVLNFFISNASLGTHLLDIEIVKDGDTVKATRNYLVIERDESLFEAPVVGSNGLFHYLDSTFLFQIYAPQKEHVFLLTPQNNYRPDIDYKLHRSTDNNTFWIRLPKSDFERGQTTYQYLIDGNLVVADPYSTVVLDPFHDAFIDEEILAELPAYPEGMTSGVVSAFDYDDEGYPWTDFENYVKPDQSELVIYELLLRDFLADHSYESLIDTLDYLSNLGITAIELMPINEFEGNQSWGYNPSFHMAVDKYYGSRRQLKAFVDEAHSRGIAVILDVVYNHVFSQSPLAQMYWDPGAFRPAPDNPWLNVIPKHPFNVGYDVNHESQATKEWVKQTLGYWMAEFHIDGFRFDLSKGFTQLNSGGNADLMAQYDPGRIAILKDYADFVWSVSDDAYVILEHFAYNEEEIELANYGMMLWGNMHHEFGEAARARASDLEWLDYTERGWDSPNVVGYMESHDEERQMVMLDGAGFSLERALERMETASAIFYLVPGPKMLWQFGELGFDYSINRCVNGSINNDCRLDPKPIVWDYRMNEERAELYEVVSKILHLKKTFPTFNSNDFLFNDGNLFLKTIHFNHPDMDAVVMVNFRETTSEINPKFQNPGVWYEYFTGDSLVVEDTEEKIAHIGGEYRIYTSERITPPGGFTTSNNDVEIAKVALFPNPAHPGDRITIESDSKVEELKLIDVMGRVLCVERNSHAITLPTQILSGIYYLEVSMEDGVIRQPMVIQLR